MALAVDVGSAGLALGVEAVEGQLEALLAGLAGVDRAADLALDLGPAHAAAPGLAQAEEQRP